MIVEFLTAAVLELDPDYDDNTAKARYLQDIVINAIDQENYLMACEGQKLITHYMIKAGRPITERMIQDSLDLEQQLCRISEDNKL